MSIQSPTSETENLLSPREYRMPLDNESMTSFSNPNYALHADALNSNLPDVHTTGLKSPESDDSTFTSPTTGEQRLVRVQHSIDDEDEQGNRGFSGYYSSIAFSKEPISNDNTGRNTYDSIVNSPDSNDSGIQADSKRLPDGWEKHEDEKGPYYWHVKSGKIQRDKPSEEEVCVSVEQLDQALAKQCSTTRETSNETRRCQLSESNDSEKPVRYAVRSLGWVRMQDEDLTPERSSKAVNKCIVDLSLGRNDINDVVGRWGDGKDLYMDIDMECLKLIDPQDTTIVNIQPIQSIRVWGVGRDNGRERDFAYVARDTSSKRHMCHVFRCDTPAKQIAHTLRDVCRKIMQKRKIAQQTCGAGSARRPNNLPNLADREGATGCHESVNFDAVYRATRFPTPMEEPRKMIRCHYLGSCQVARPTGVEVLNQAMDKLLTSVPRENWLFVAVSIAPSTITIADNSNNDHVLAECRVRFLSFMGISKKNVQVCAFIMHTVQDSFIAYIFHCEPTAGPLCKTIEAACKLRFQKCLDAHPHTPDGRAKAAQASRGFGASIKQGVQTVLGKIGKSKSKSES